MLRGQRTEPFHVNRGEGISDDDYDDDDDDDGFRVWI